MRGKWLRPTLLIALLTGSAAAREQKIHGYVSAVHGPASFDIDDYRILRDRSVTIEFVTEDDDQNAGDYPKEIRVGSEIEIRGDLDGQTHELKARSIKVFTRESRRLKRTAILDQVPQLHKNGVRWEGSFRADGQTIVVDETTTVSIAPNASQKKAIQQEAKQAARRGETSEQMLTRLDDVHVNMYVSYEGARLDDGRIRAKKVQFRDEEMTSAKARLWKSFTPKVATFRGTRPGELNLGEAGKFRLTPNAEVQDYVRKLGQRLVPASQKQLAPGDPNRIPFQFFVAESRGINAFATPNGVVVVHRDMLAAAETEGQLAAVIGHEIAHATQEHTLRQMEFHKKKRLLLQIGAAVAEAYGKYNVRDLLNLASAAIRNGYQRYLENQADRVGMGYVLAAGYDPREAARFWKTIASKTGDSPTNFFWSDHDNNTTRRSYLMSELAMNYQGVGFEALAQDSDEFHRIRGIVGGRDAGPKHRRETATVRLPASPEHVQPAQAAPPSTESEPEVAATFELSLKPAIPRLPRLPARRPVLPPQSQPVAAAPVPSSETPDTAAAAYDALRARDYDRAVAGFLQLLETSPMRASVRKDLAYTYLKIGETALARDQFHEVLKADPDDTQIALEYAFLCNETRQEAEARRVFDRLRRAGNATAEQAFRNIDGPLAAGIERWKKAIEMGADDFAAHYELATLAEKRDELALAAEHYERAWRILPIRRSVLVDLGRVWTALGRAEQANAALMSAVFGGETRAAESARELLPGRFPYVAEFRRALLFDPGNPDLRRELAYLLLRMERQSEAEVEFRYLADNFPDDLLSATQLGFLLQNRGERKAAQPLFDRVLAGKDEDLANRVRAVLRLPQTLQSRADSGSPQVDNKVMADRSFKAGYLKDALKYLRNAHEADPGDFGVMLQLGWTHNILHEDTRAFEWFNRARKSPDPQIAGEAEKAWRNLRFENQRIRTTGWFYPMYSTRWHDGFGYAQIKTELRAAQRLHIYASTRLVGDTRLGVGVLPPNLSERAVIVGGGLMLGPWHGLVAWGEAGTSISYLTGHMLPDYRGGLSYGRGFGHGLRSESGGFFADTAADLVFVSRFGNDTLLYDQSRFGYTFGPSGFRAQLYWNANATVDQQRQPWANFGETGPGIRMGGAMYFTFNLVRGIYFVRRDNPRPRTFSDFRAGVWYAFTR